MANDENFEIVVTIDPTEGKRGADVIDRELVGMERQAKVSSKEMSKAIGASMREAAAAARRHNQQIAAEARAAANAGKMAARDEARARTAAQREAAAAAKEAARAQVQAQREIEAAARKANAEYERQAHAATRAAARAQASSARQLARSNASVDAGVAGRLSGPLMAASAGLFGAREAMELADAYTNASNRIRTLTKDSAELAFVQGELFKVAQATGSEYASTVELYQKVGKAALGMGRSQSEAVKLTELITKAIKASGAEGASASAAIQQLGQALDSGTLRGEEFNSVNEQAPILLDLLGKSLGKTRGELRKMAEAGELTADVVIKGLEDQRTAATVNEMYGKRVATVSENITRFKNELSKMFGELSANAGVAEAFGTVLGTIGSALASIGSVIGTVVGGVRDLNDALGSVPTDTIKAVLSFGKYTIPVYGQLILVNDKFTTPGPAKGTGFDARTPEEFAAEDARAAAEQFARDVKWQERARSGGTSDWTRAREQMERDRQTQEQVSNWNAIRSFRPGQSQMSVADPRVTAEMDRKAAEDLRIAVRDGVFKAQRIIGDVLPETLGGRKLPKEKKTGAKATPKDVYDWVDAFEELGAEVQGYAEILGGEALSAAEDFSRQRAAIAEEERGYAQEAVDGWKAYQEQVEKNEIALKAQAEALAEVKASMLEDTLVLRDGLRDAFTNAFDDTLSAAIAWENNFKDIFRRLAQEVAFFLAKILALKAVQGIFGAYSGTSSGTGIGSVLGGLLTGNFGRGFVGGKAFAGGGDFRVGGTGGPDSQGVFFRATPGEFVSVTNPNLMNGGGSSGAPGVSVPLSIQLAGDPSELIHSYLSSPEGERLIVNVFGKHGRTMRAALAR